MVEKSFFYRLMRANMTYVHFRAFCAVFVSLTLCASTGFAADGCALKQIASIPASLSPNGTLLLDVTLNGIPVKIAAVTNSDLSTVHEKFARRANMPIEDVHGSVYSTGKRLMSQKTEISSMELGGAKATNGTFILDPNGEDGTDGGSVGALSSDYLSSYDLEIDLANGKVNLFDHDHCKGQVVYWAKEYFASPIFLSDTGQRRKPEMTVVADGKSLRAVIATGYSVTTLRQAVAEDRLNLVPGSPEMQKTGAWTDSDGHQFDRYSHIFQTLTFGSIKTLHNSKVFIEPINMAAHIQTVGTNISKANAQQPDIYIGMSLLKQLHIFIAYDENMIYYTVASSKQAASQ
jgi:hypothetical protein